MVETMLLQYLLPFAQQDTSTINDAAAGAAGAGIGLGMMVVYAAIYLIFGFLIMRLADKMGEQNSWWAFIPILNYCLIAKMAGKEWFWGLLVLIPCVNLIGIYYFYLIAEKRGKPPISCLLLFIPLVNMGYIWWLAQD